VPGLFSAVGVSLGRWASCWAVPGLLPADGVPSGGPPMARAGAALRARAAPMVAVLMKISRCLLW